MSRLDRADSRAVRVAALVAALVAVALTAAACGSSSDSSSDEAAAEKPATASPDKKLTQREIVDKARSGTVSIVAIPPGETTPPAKGGRHGHASGVVYDAEKGLVLTSDHFIEGAGSIRVTVNEKTEVRGRAVARAQCNDFALLSLHPKPPGLVALPFGRSSDLSGGDPVTAVGYLKPPEAKKATLISNSGNVSAVDVSGEVHPTLPALSSLILHQAPLQLSMSGGALVDEQARLVGLATLIKGGSGDKGAPYDAVPSDFLKKRLADLKPGKGDLYSGWEEEHVCHRQMAALSAMAMGLSHPPGGGHGGH